MEHETRVTAEAYRRAMRSFATGVVVVAVQNLKLVHGMTANALMSVSVDLNFRSFQACT